MKMPRRLAALLVCAALAALAAPAADPASEITEHYTRMMKYHGYMDGSVPEGAVLFIGDSITQGLCTAAVCERGVNYGIGSDTTVGVLQRLPEYRSMDRARAVVVAIGVNDLRRRDNAALLENYRKIAAAVAERAPLLFSAVLPLDERLKEDNRGVNARIRELNAGLAALCAERGDCRVVDVFDALLDTEGSLATAHHTGDGVHLSDKGYAVWITALRGALETLPPRAAKG